MRETAVKAWLVYVVGASGSGKDSLLRYARARLATNISVVFAHRYITRDASAGGENHVALSAAEFAARERAGLFALAWESHGNAYGIGIEVNQWLAKGMTVVVNGSREYLPEVQRLYPELLSVCIDVSQDVLQDRLTARGREGAKAIAARLARHHKLQGYQYFSATINNDGELAKGGDALVDLILQCAKENVCV